jgi:hypothetical protein
LGKRHPDGNSSLLGEPPFLDRDPTQPNEAFFKNVDYVLSRANELGPAFWAGDRTAADFFLCLSTNHPG